MKSEIRRKSESLFNKIKQLISTGFFHIISGNVISKCITFSNSIILVRILTKQEYGRFSYVWNIYSIAIILNGMGAVSAVLQLCSEHSEDEVLSKRICNFGMLYGTLSSIVLSIILLFIGLIVPLNISQANDIFLFLCALPLPQFLFELFLVCLRTQKRNQDYARIALAKTAICLIFSVLGAFLFKEKGLILGYSLSYIFSDLICYKGVKNPLISKDRTLPNRSERKEMLSISIVSTVIESLSQIMYLLDIFVLGILDPQETVLASYKVAAIIPSALAFIPSSIIVYIYPYFAEHRFDKQWCLQKYRKMTVAFGLFNLLLTALLFVLAQPIIQIVYGMQYLDAVPVFRLLLINFFILATFRQIAGNLLVTQRKLKFNLFVGIVSSSANIIADYFFIQWWGSVGAALATILVTILSAFLYSSYYVHVLKNGRIS